ncbi:hypothetical protein LSTR_LSTR010184 [Laodelphax striatellus]|uniref:Peroxisomal membrane protein 2 n=1 Tax=Laodelphax striatellus TaxID=195883 RepID=A0A482WPQ5_LAOST|nr:hypothetical protein LSTR_LSTR010184 [Laodelphax striatellus]
MSMSKPANILFDLVGSYFAALYTNPIRTKAFTSCTITLLGNYVSQKIQKSRSFDQDVFIAFGLYGLIFGGTIPHFFFNFLEKSVPGDSRIGALKQFLIERLIYAPLYQAFSLYALARFEGKTHEDAVSNMSKLYLPVLKANWYYLSLFQYINFRMVPPMLKVLYVNLIGFFWSIFLSYKKSRAMDKKKDAKKAVGKRL